ncbi:MAG: hypothetical protein A2525_00905 [Sulfurimonas sp. RIFOXYD12_FULL_36_11]|jgi:hypothetical protein|nr:MAG: hypothetical protein A2540_10675 [Sulfurimonas sp. RIFOXYD2_FULL_37_8]OHE21253.1 MAG: hypothetical protein A2525_00905 [Sulfurimonas sp. RIFOXYD12_FULL_36_11]
MLYIVAALKSEAQAFVDKYKLTKTKCGNFTLFIGEDLKLVISGIGSAKAKKATSMLIEKFVPIESDIFINVGICGANQKYKIGKLLEIGSVIYEDKTFVINENLSHVLTCKESEVYDNFYEIVDMESFGFYEATKEIRNRRIYKVVSDHFEPSCVTKEGTKMLISSVINEIIQKAKI